jgi:hypothetical protein
MGFWKHLLFATTMVALAQAPAPKADATVAERLRQDVTFLASPELKGRGNGYPELDQAARRIEGELKALGLVTQVQRFPFIAKVARERQGATLIQGANPRPLAWGKDIEALGLSGDAAFQNRDLVFLGYGVQVAGGYDDLAGFDLKDKVAVISRAVPDLDVFARLPRGERGLLARLKRLEAAKVAGVIVLEEGGLRPLQREEGPVKLEIPVVGVTAEALDGACGDLAASFKTIKDTGKPASRVPGTTLSLELKMRREEALSSAPTWTTSAWASATAWAAPRPAAWCTQAQTTTPPAPPWWWSWPGSSSWPDRNAPSCCCISAARRRGCSAPATGSSTRRRRWRA